MTENDWNDESVAIVESLGKDSHVADKYRAGKTLAEKAAWRFIEERKGEIGFDLVVLHPPYIFGPILHSVDKAEDLNWSTNEWFDAVIKGTKTKEELVNIRYVSASTV